MSITLDYRETHLAQCFDALGQTYKTENLLVGDIHIESETPQFKVIIERKTFNDLSSSIIDNRFREQRARLDTIKSENKDSNLRIMYIIEGSKNTRGVSQNVITGALLGLVLRNGFGLFYSNSTKHTAEVCCSILKKILKGDLIQ